MSDRDAPDRRADRDATDDPRFASDASRAAADSADWLRAVIHELAGLIDGSMRCLRLARKDLAALDLGARATDATTHLEAANHALDHMTDLIRTVADAAGRFTPGPGLVTQRPTSEAITHAVDVIRPLATERRIALHCTVNPVLDRLPPAPVYPVIANALRNAIDAIGRDGEVRITAAVDPDVTPQRITIEILDDGCGPPEPDPSRAFILGFTTKRRGSGLGLALARDIINDLGGSITLVPRWPASAINPDPATRGRRGARLRIIFPAERHP